MSVKPIPDGYNTVTPYLVLQDVAKELEFLQKAFDAKVTYRMDTPNGTVHAEVKIGNSMVMLGQADDAKGSKPTQTMLYLYVEDCDKAYEKAVRAGGTSVAEVKDQFYGDRSGGVKDPYGNQWWVATHKEDVSHEELERRAKEAHKQTAKA